MEIKIDGLDDIKRACMEFLELSEGHRVFAFSAEMGTGKTTFIVSLLKAMGVEDIEGSPTYSLVNSYSSPVYGAIHHFDLYRIESEDEAYDIGIEEMLYNNDVCFIEWPEKIKEILPESAIWVYIRINEDNTRTLIAEL